jgi:hypothetical protein
MTLSKLSLEDKFGVNSSHFFKSGNIPQSEISQELKNIVKFIPSNGPYSSNIDYDIWFDMRDYPKVHGYCYTDVLSNFIMLRCCSAKHSEVHIEHVIRNSGVNDLGIQIYNHLVENNTDKYSLRKIRNKFVKEDLKAVAFLPGNKIYDSIVDLEKLDKFVEENNAKIKFHPLTPEILESKVSRRYGKNRLISSKFSGHEIMENAEIVAVGRNSEMGLISAIKNKKVVMFDKAEEERVYTYTHLYKNIVEKEFGYFGDDDTYETRFKKLFSSNYSGLISKFCDVEEHTTAFFNYYKQFEHVKPKKLQLEEAINLL